MIRRLLPSLLLPLCLAASILTVAPWLRAFPADIAAFPLIGAAVISVLLPVAIQAFTARLWIAALVEIGVFILYTLLVVLHAAGGFDSLVTGLYRGPSEILTFALPLVSPRSLMVAPVALTWLVGAVGAECATRRWATVIPYVGFVVAFGLAYAGTERAAGDDRLRETLLGAGLVAVLMLLRAAQVWVRQDDDAEQTQPDGVLPIRGFTVGVVTTLVLTAVAALVVQAGAFPKKFATPQRVPSVDNSHPVDPLGFVSQLRPADPKSKGSPAFTVTVHGKAPSYFDIANVDDYDGIGWSFQRTFRPSGGVLPADTDTALRSHGASVTQNYTIAPGSPLADAPWMPVLYRAKDVTGVTVDIDPASGMIVPAAGLAAGAHYTVTSAASLTTFDELKAAKSAPDLATSSSEIELPPGTLRTTLDKLVQSFSRELNVPTSPALPFLQALTSNLRSQYALSTPDEPLSPATGTSTAATSAPATSTPAPPSTSASSAHHTSTRGHRPSKHPSSHASGHRPKDAGAVPLARPTHRPAHPSRATSHAQSHGASAPARHTPTPSPTPTSAAPTAPANAQQRAGSTTFADVAASILGPDHSGTPEQFATLVALIARDLGVPARVATGFRLLGPGNVSHLVAGTYTLTTADAWTWVEIPIVGRGWVVLDASPGTYRNTQQQSQGATQPPSSTPPSSQNQLQTKGNNGNAVAPPSAVPRSHSHQQSVWVPLLIVLGAVVLLLLLTLLARKPVRARRRRRATDPRDQLLGAWQEGLDRLAEAGLPDLRALTSTEVADLTGEQFGPESRGRADELAAAANAAAYRTSVAVLPAEADAAWTAERRLNRAVVRRLSLGGRLRYAFSYHRRDRSPRPVSPRSWIESAAALRGRPSGGSRRGLRRLGRHRRSH